MLPRTDKLPVRESFALSGFYAELAKTGRLGNYAHDGSDIFRVYTKDGMMDDGSGDLQADIKEHESAELLLSEEMARLPKALADKPSVATYKHGYSALKQVVSSVLAKERRVVITTTVSLCVLGPIS